MVEEVVPAVAVLELKVWAQPEPHVAGTAALMVSEPGREGLRILLEISLSWNSCRICCI